MKTIDGIVARKVLETVDAGLVQGKGYPVPGQMCVEAAVCFALGLPHSDEPPCVGSAVRRYKIQLNDSAWSSNKARAKGMRRVAVAQLGSNKIDQRKFSESVIIEGVKRILPIAARAAAGVATASSSAAILALVPACEAAASLSDARQAASQLRTALRATYATYAADAADAAADAADAAAYAAYAAADACAYAAAASAARDKVLSLAAEIAVEALQAQNCDGCQWLPLCDEVAA